MYPIHVQCNLPEIIFVGISSFLTLVDCLVCENAVINTLSGLVASAENLLLSRLYRATRISKIETMTIRTRRTAAKISPVMKGH